MNWEDEVALIAASAAIFNIDPLWVQTIRKVENGSARAQDDCEFGVIKFRGKGYAIQLKACCETVAQRVMQYSTNPFKLYPTSTIRDRLGYNFPFIIWFASLWAPTMGDTTGLNKNWPDNAMQVYPQLIREVRDDG